MQEGTGKCKKIAGRNRKMPMKYKGNTINIL